jgi:hypothetical protein
VRGQMISTRLDYNFDPYTAATLPRMQADA